MHWRAWSQRIGGCLVVAGAIAGLGCCQPLAEQPRWVTTVFPTEGMTCGGCEHAIQAAVGKLGGVKLVRASHLQKRTEVTYDAVRVRPEQIVAAINQLGYRARLPGP